MEHSVFVFDLAIVLCVAGITAVFARACRQSTVLGYLFAGLIVGPYLRIPVFADPARVGALAEFGVILVMFALGLEFRIAKLRRVLPVSGLTGVLQVAFLAWSGIAVGGLLGWGATESTFLGASLAISSTMVVFKVFEQVDVPKDAREHVLGVLVVQDVLAIVLIAAMTAVAAGGGLGPGALAATLARLGAVLFLLTAGGLLIVPRAMRRVSRLRSREISVVVAIGLSFGMAVLAQEFGYSVALGAFLAGILVAESGRGRSIEPLVQPLRDVFASVFFVSIGMTVDPRIALEHLPLAIGVFAVVVLGQLFSVTVAGLLSGLGIRRSVTAGLALGQIGEFSFILAAIGVQAGVVRPELQAVLVTVAVFTAFSTPLLLGASDRVVRTVDRLLPGRIHRVLAVYGAWLERSRQEAPPRRSPARRALRVLALDTVVLLLLLAACSAWVVDLAAWVEARFGLPSIGARTIVVAFAVALALPVLIGLVRNTVHLASWAGENLLERNEQPTPGAQLAYGIVRTLVVLVVLLAVGMPSIAVLRPLMDASYGMALLLTVVSGVGLHLWRNAGAMESEYLAGVEQLAGVLARQTGDEPEPVERAPALLPGLEDARHETIDADSGVAGLSLAELDLRARTGATVVAIRRREAGIVLPTGQERLGAGDTLVLVGSDEALDQASALLAGR